MKLREVQVTRKEVNISDFIRRPAELRDIDTELIKDDVKLMDGEKLLGIYMKLPTKNEQVLQAVRSLKYTTSRRTVGLLSTSKIFGFMPRETIRKDYCSSTAFAREDPIAHQVICNYAKELGDFYKQTCPDMYESHLKEAMDKIKPEWRIKNSPFTSGIINKDNQLNYHFDAGNLNNVYSNMVAYKKDIEGGNLIMPEYNIGLEIADNTVTFFDGQNVLHGVSPFEKLSQGAYRYTLVYYTLKQMWKCEEVTEELARIRKVKTERENKRLLGIQGKLKFCPKCGDWTEPLPNCKECGGDYVKKKSRNTKMFTELGIPLDLIGVPFSDLPSEVQKKLNDYKRK
jgi:hypothetical protein